MSYLLDTNVLAETIKPKPNEAVVNWLNSIPQDSLCISVLTFGEIRKGVEKMTSGKRKTLLAAWLEHNLIDWFGNKMIPVDFKVADCWGSLCAKSRNPLPAIDSLLAATALAYNLKLVTRNTADFDFPGLQVIDPWL